MGEKEKTMSKKKRLGKKKLEQWKLDLKIYGIGTTIVIGIWCIFTVMAFYK
jgi:hypothetical protein